MKLQIKCSKKLHKSKSSQRKDIYKSICKNSRILKKNQQPKDQIIMIATVPKIQAIPRTVPKEG